MEMNAAYYSKLVDSRFSDFHKAEVELSKENNDVSVAKANKDAAWAKNDTYFKDFQAKYNDAKKQADMCDLDKNVYANTDKKKAKQAANNAAKLRQQAEEYKRQLESIQRTRDEEDNNYAKIVQKEEADVPIAQKKRDAAEKLYTQAQAKQTEFLKQEAAKKAEEEKQKQLLQKQQDEKKLATLKQGIEKNNAQLKADPNRKDVIESSNKYLNSEKQKIEARLNGSGADVDKAVQQVEINQANEDLRRQGLIQDALQAEANKNKEQMEYGFVKNATYQAAETNLQNISSRSETIDANVEQAKNNLDEALDKAGYNPSSNAGKKINVTDLAQAYSNKESAKSNLQSTQAEYDSVYNMASVDIQKLDSDISKYGEVLNNPNATEQDKAIAQKNIDETNKLKSKVQEAKNKLKSVETNLKNAQSMYEKADKAYNEAQKKAQEENEHLTAQVGTEKAKLDAQNKHLHFYENGVHKISNKLAGNDYLKMDSVTTEVSVNQKINTEIEALKYEVKEAEQKYGRDSIQYAQAITKLNTSMNEVTSDVISQKEIQEERAENIETAVNVGLIGTTIVTGGAGAYVAAFGGAGLHSGINLYDTNADKGYISKNDVVDTTEGFITESVSSVALNGIKGKVVDKVLSSAETKVATIIKNPKLHDAAIKFLENVSNFGFDTAVNLTNEAGGQAIADALQGLTVDQIKYLIEVVT